MTEIPEYDTYSGVASSESVYCAFFLAELKGLDVWATDFGNAHLRSHTKEKVYAIADPKFGPLAGYILI
jgi:hypothetical protein